MNEDKKIEHRRVKIKVRRSGYGVGVGPQWCGVNSVGGQKK